MPWPHCANQINDDDVCPSCGLSKQEWTIKFDVTRKFTIGSRPVVKVVLLDAQGEFAAGQQVKIALPDQSIFEKELNAAGYAKGTSKLPGMAEVRFPGVEGKVLCDHPEAQQAGESYFVPTGKDKYEFRLAADVSDQVDTLLRAAANGTAFCEKCEQRKREQQQAEAA